MIHLIHGDDTAKSYQCLIDLKAKLSESGAVAKELDATRTTKLQWEDFLNSDQLFGNDFLVIFNLSANKEKNIKDLLDLDKEIIVYEKKKIDRPLMDKNVKQYKFELDQMLFKLCEALVPNNQHAIFTLYTQSLSNNPWELVFTMIVRQFRLMIYALENPANSPEWGKTQDWLKGKIQSQAQRYTSQQLKEIYAKLLKIDHCVKTSQEPTVQLELLLASL